MQKRGLYCPICGCWYDESIAAVGEQCGDLSHRQSDPCPGVLARCDPTDAQYREFYKRHVLSRSSL
jgi:hypothetical protein